ncbi:dihydropyrimidinase [Limisalsivibrio acetivorans]|uniref:dihydropyrimidinase n=1 Tax=Limisalsivibrio acetivorans TaxID=1304888 RepID=UPI0003B44ADA|nr:dihydropyrimidinase [Limisalsivibrio acetivorans]
MKTLIKNGTLVTPEGSLRGDLLMENGRIARIEDEINCDCGVIDASEKLVLPGGVDVHTHTNLIIGGKRVSDGFYHGSLAALAGGTTTIVDHPEAGAEESGLLDQPEMYLERMQRECICDFSIHGVIHRTGEDIVSDMPELIRKGFTSMKMYMTYASMLSDDEIASLLPVITENGGLACFHAEDDSLINDLRKQYALEGKLSPIYHAKSRPNCTEADAVKRLIEISARCGNAPIYIVHLSTKEGLEIIRNAKSQGVNVIAETCPQYLMLDESRYEEPDGLKYIMAPPLRTEDDCEALWGGISDGTIDVVATDHCSYSYADKVKYGSDDFRNAPGGAPGVETRLPLLFSEGVKRGRISLEQFVKLVSTSPADIMGLGNRKGRIAPGYDADILIWNSDAETVLSAERMQQRCDYTPFEGFEVTGMPETVFLRGKKVYDTAGFYAGKGNGEFIPRTKREY